MTNHESSYESTSHRYLWMKNNGQAGWRFRLTDNVANTSIVIVVPHEQVVTMLKEQGLYVTTLAEAEKALKDLTAEQAAKLDAIAKVLERKDLEGEHIGDGAIDALQEVYNILHPAPPYTLPTKYGAVVKGSRPELKVTRYFTLAMRNTKSDVVWVDDMGGWYTAAEVQGSFPRGLETISEGVDE